MAEKFQLHLGNCLDVLKGFPDNSIDSIVTDPPYGLTQNKKGGTGVKSINLDSPYGRSRIGTGNGSGGFMGQKWDADVPSVEIWAECLRVLKPGGNLLCFAGTRTQHRMVARVVESGFELQDVTLMCYGSGFPKSLNIAKAIDQRRAGNDVIRPWLKSLGTKEEIASAAKVTPRQVDHWLGENTPCPQTLTEERFILLCQHFNTVPEWADKMFKKVGDKLGEITHSRSGGEDFAKIPGSKSEKRTEDVTALVTDAAKQWEGWHTSLKPAYEPISLYTKGGPLTLHADFKRLYYCAKASKRERNLGLTSDVTNGHPTVKPLKLMEQLCQLATPKGGVILDPFMGSGTTGIAALNLGFNFVGIDMGKEYFDIASLRLNSLFPQGEE